MTGKKNVVAPQVSLDFAKTGKVYRSENSAGFSPDVQSLKDESGASGELGSTPSDEQGWIDGSTASVVINDDQDVFDSNSTARIEPLAERRTSCDRSNLALNIGEVVDLARDATSGGVSGSGGRRRTTKAMLAESRTMEEDWVLLDCYFGIPLFDANANQQICRRIASQKLCNKERLVICHHHHHSYTTSSLPH